jgi:hypothetical protein
LALAGTLFTTNTIAAGSGYGGYGYTGAYGGAGYGGYGYPGVYGGAGYGYGNYGGCGRRTYGTSTAIILVLFILITIVARRSNNIGC